MRKNIRLTKWEKCRCRHFDYYLQSEDAISAVTCHFPSIVIEKGWDDFLSMPDHKGKGLNLYYNFNSSLSSRFELSNQCILDVDQTPRRMSVGSISPWGTAAPG